MSKYLKTILIILGILVIVGFLVFSDSSTPVVEVNEVSETETVDYEKQKEYFRNTDGFELISKVQFENVQSNQSTIPLEDILDDSVAFDESIQTYDGLLYLGFSEELDSYVFGDGHVAAYIFYKANGDEKVSVYGDNLQVTEDYETVTSYMEASSLGLYNSTVGVINNFSSTDAVTTQVNPGAIDGWDVKGMKFVDDEIFVHLSVRFGSWNQDSYMMENAGTEDVYIKI